MKHKELRFKLDSVKHEAQILEHDGKAQLYFDVTGENQHLKKATDIWNDLKTYTLKLF